MPVLQALAADLLPIICGCAAWAALAVEGPNPAQAGLSAEASVLAVHSLSLLLCSGYKDKLLQQPLTSASVALCGLVVYCLVFMGLRGGGEAMALQPERRSGQRFGQAMLQKDKNVQKDKNSGEVQEIEVTDQLQAALLLLQRGFTLLLSLGLQLGPWESVALPLPSVRRRIALLQQHVWPAGEVVSSPALETTPSSTDKSMGDGNGMVLGLQRSVLLRRKVASGKCPDLSEDVPIALGGCVPPAPLEAAVLGLQRSADLHRGTAGALHEDDEGSEGVLRPPAPAASAQATSFGLQRSLSLQRHAAEAPHEDRQPLGEASSPSSPTAMMQPAALGLQRSVRLQRHQVKTPTEDSQGFEAGPRSQEPAAAVQPASLGLQLATSLQHRAVGTLLEDTQGYEEATNSGTVPALALEASGLGLQRSVSLQRQAAQALVEDPDGCDRAALGLQPGNGKSLEHGETPLTEDVSHKSTRRRALPASLLGFQQGVNLQTKEVSNDLQGKRKGSTSPRATRFQASTFGLQSGFRVVRRGLGSKS